MGKILLLCMPHKVECLLVTRLGRSLAYLVLTVGLQIASCNHESLLLGSSKEDMTSCVLLSYILHPLISQMILQHPCAYVPCLQSRTPFHADSVLLSPLVL